MRPRILYLGTLIVGMGLWAVFVQVHHQSLREEAAGLRARLEGVETLRAENVRLKGVLTRRQMHDYELERLRREAQDVVRLRGEVTSLQNLRQENQELTTEIYQLSNQLQTAMQIASDWQNYKTTARAGTQPNGPTEIVRQPVDEPASLVSSERQLTGTGPANFPQHSEAVSQPLPGLMTSMPGSSAEPGPGPGSMPPDHARSSNQDCASCHGGAATPQDRTDSEALLGTAETLVSRH